MESHRVARADSQVWKGKTWAAHQERSSKCGQRDLLCGEIGLRLETFAERFSLLANRLWLLPTVEPGLDVDFHSRHAARLAPENRRAQRRADGGHCGQPIGQNTGSSGRTRL